MKEQIFDEKYTEKRGPVEIIIVEDDLMTAMFLSHILIFEGYKVMDILMTGKDAIQYLQKRDVDLVLLDTALRGEMNGVETARQIKLFRDVPMIYFITGPEGPDLSRILDAAPELFINRPVMKSELMSKINAVLGRHSGFANEYGKDRRFKDLYALMK